MQSRNHFPSHSSNWPNLSIFLSSGYWKSQKTNQIGLETGVSHWYNRSFKHVRYQLLSRQKGVGEGGESITLSQCYNTLCFMSSYVSLSLVNGSFLTLLSIKLYPFKSLVLKNLVWLVINDDEKKEIPMKTTRFLLSELKTIHFLMLIKIIRKVLHSQINLVKF